MPDLIDDYRCTDAGNGLRLADHAGTDLRHCREWGWLAWTGKRWAREADKAALRAWLAVAERYRDACAARFAGILALPAGTPGREIAETHTRWAAGCESLTRARCALEMAAAHPALATSAAQFDAEPWLLSVGTGTVDLRTGQLRAASRDDLLTAGTDVDPREIPYGCRWDQFLREILPDADTRAYIQRAIGLSIIGEQRDHAIFLAYGTGGNGKGAFFRALRSALGDYYTALPAGMLIEQPYQPHAAQVAKLAGKRLAVSSEIARGKRLDEAKVKELTGGDTITAQYMRENWFDFTPSHTLWVCANDRPRIAGTDRGIWRRMKCIPFVTQIADGNMDPDLDAKLAAEAGYVLRWCLDGVAEYLRAGLGTCPEVAAATAEYRASEDTMGACLEDMCDFGEGLRVAKVTFRAAMAAWYSDAGMSHIATDKTIKADFERRGFGETRPDGQGWHWTGLGLKPEWRDRAAGTTTDKPTRRGWHTD